MRKLVLYSTVGCHLCEQAKEILLPLLAAEDSVEELDIADADELMALYGIRIPVIKCLHSEREIGWPFDRAQLAEFLGQ